MEYIKHLLMVSVLMSSLALKAEQTKSDYLKQEPIRSKTNKQGTSRFDDLIEARRRRQLHEQAEKLRPRSQTRVLEQ